MTIHTKTAGTHTVSTAYALSQYYTHTQIAAAYVAQVLARYANEPFDVVIEPSAGTGAFSRHLGDDCIALDLDPKAPGIIRTDFLSLMPTVPMGRCLIIGNPPFGGNAALNFLNHAARLADVVAFILPATFRKKTQQNHVDRRLHLVHEEEVPQYAFIYEGKVVHVPCVLQIWERRSELRQLHMHDTTHPHFERCSAAEADLVIRRVGAHAGQLKPVEKDWSPQSNIFLRATGVTPVALKERFARLDMSKQARNGVGGGSINMSEIVELYSALLEEDMQREVAEPSIEMLRRIVLPIPASDEAPSSEKAGSPFQQSVVPKPTIGDRESRATRASSTACSIARTFSTSRAEATGCAISRTPSRADPSSIPNGPLRDAS